MDTKQKSFMLLPNFYFKPEDPLKLGLVLPLSASTKRPDPEKILNASTHIPVAQTDKKTSTFNNWNVKHTESHSFSTGLWADVSMLTGVGAGGNLGRSRQNGLTVRCESMTVEWFTPSDEYILHALKNNLVRSYLQKPTIPSVYMITGMMVVEKAVVIMSDGKDNDIEGEFSFDGTQFGVPIKIGPKAGVSAEEQSSITFQSDEPFILAYRLKRIRRKRDGSAKQRDYNKWALFNDDSAARAGSSEALQDMEIEDVDPDTVCDM